mmetsp:Transcript_19497/g.39994  ORF Transcript_19497/g.39994 Transcript_19497/m.39994 type:complete len:668 (-) Transcript_19497:94-2097(-)
MVLAIYLALALPRTAATFHFQSSAVIAPNHHTIRKGNGINLPSIQPPPSHPSQSFRLMSSKDDEANEKEQFMAQQKSEAYHALSSFHETSASFISESNGDKSNTANGSTSSSSFKDVIEELGSLMSNAEERMGGGARNLNMANYWECSNGATLYLVPMDPAAGLKKGVSSKPYKTSVQVELDLDGILYGRSGKGKGSRQLRLRETYTFLDEEGKELASSVPFSRSVILGPNVDVDSVDGSYSLDDTVTLASEEVGSEAFLPLLPPSFLVDRMDPSKIKFLVENTLVVSETERCRCFLIYGDADGGVTMDADGEENGVDVERNYRLLGIIIAEERKVMPEKETDVCQDESSLIREKSSDEQVNAESSTTSPPLELFDTMSEEQKKEERMKRLFQTIERHNKQVLRDAVEEQANAALEDQTNTAFERHNIGLYGITSGTFLGDAIIREPIPSKKKLFRIKEERQGRGFGKNPPKQTKSKEIVEEHREHGEDGFANWNTGVQKVSLHYSWDYSNSIMQSYEWGRSLGTYTSMACGENNKSIGTIVMNESKRLAKKGEAPRVIMDMNGGRYIAGLIGSTYFRAPRYLSFSRVRSYNHEPYLIEFMTFYRLPEKSSTVPTSLNGDIIEGPGYYCSRMSRLYNSLDGSILQGSTAFFTMSHPLPNPDSGTPAI